MIKRLILILLIATLFSSCGPYKYVPSRHDVMYEIVGTSTAVDINLQDKDGIITELQNVSLPWSYTFWEYAGRVVEFTAQNTPAGGSITANIYIDNILDISVIDTGIEIIVTARTVIPSD